MNSDFNFSFFSLLFQTSGTCVWHGVCSNGLPYKYCSYNGTAKELNVDEQKALSVRCSHLLGNDKTLTCCDIEQVSKSLKNVQSGPKQKEPNLSRLSHETKAWSYNNGKVQNMSTIYRALTALYCSVESLWRPANFYFYLCVCTRASGSCNWNFNQRNHKFGSE